MVVSRTESGREMYAKRSICNNFNPVIDEKLDLTCRRKLPLFRSVKLIETHRILKIRRKITYWEIVFV